MYLCTSYPMYIVLCTLTQVHSIIHAHTLYKVQYYVHCKQYLVPMYLVLCTQYLSTCMDKIHSTCRSTRTARGAELAAGAQHMSCRMIHILHSRTTTTSYIVRAHLVYIVQGTSTQHYVHSTRYYVQVQGYTHHEVGAHRSSQVDNRYRCTMYTCTLYLLHRTVHTLLTYNNICGVRYKIAPPHIQYIVILYMYIGTCNMYVYRCTRMQISGYGCIVHRTWYIELPVGTGVRPPHALPGLYICLFCTPCTYKQHNNYMHMYIPVAPANVESLIQDHPRSDNRARRAIQIEAPPSLKQRKHHRRRSR